MKKYKEIFFDLDDTLINDTKSKYYSFSKVLDYLNISYESKDIQQFLAFDSYFWKHLYDGHTIVPPNVTNRSAYLRSLRFYLFFHSVLNISIDFPLATQINSFYIDHLEDCLVPIEGAKETILALKDIYLLGIATNGVKKLILKKLDILSIQTYISHIVCSEDAHINKPEPPFFDYLLDKCKCTKENILLVGDSLSSDIQGGMNCGIDTVWFNPNHLPLLPGYAPTYEIHHLLELTKKLAA